MQAGKLDRRITIERAAGKGRDSFNSIVEKWLPVATVWAAKQDIKDAERIAAQEVGAEVTTRFQIRWSSVVTDVNPKDRIVFEGRIYDISAVKEIGRREGIEITATARSDK